MGDDLSEQKTYREPCNFPLKPSREPERRREVEVDSSREGRPTLICRRRYKALGADIDDQPHVLVTRSIKAGVAGEDREARN